tara:strand:+ start:120 stop:314 length:195 start_codon:yes stop_codon:yes gene_type:complete
VLYINDLTIVRQTVACEKGDFMGFFSKLWSGWGKSENVLPPKETKKKKVVKKKKKKTTKKKGKK